MCVLKYVVASSFCLLVITSWPCTGSYSNKIHKNLKVGLYSLPTETFSQDSPQVEDNLLNTTPILYSNSQ